MKLAEPSTTTTADDRHKEQSKGIDSLKLRDDMDPETKGKYRYLFSRHEHTFAIPAWTSADARLGDTQHRDRGGAPGQIAGVQILPPRQRISSGVVRGITEAWDAYRR